MCELNEHMERSNIASMSDIKSNTNLLPGILSCIAATNQSIGQLTDQMAELPQFLQRALQAFFDKIIETLCAKDEAAQAQTLLLQQMHDS